MPTISLLVARALLLAAADQPSQFDSPVVTFLVAMIGILVTVVGFVVVPRLLGQLVPSARVEEVRMSLTAERDKAQVEAATWHKAHDDMKTAHDQVLQLNRDLTQSALITSTVMRTLREQAAGSPAGGE